MHARTHTHSSSSSSTTTTTTTTTTTNNNNHTLTYVARNDHTVMSRTRHCFVHRATGNKKLKEQVAVELSFFNSNIQLLKEELSEMNSSVEVYQHDK